MRSRFERAFEIFALVGLELRLTHASGGGARTRRGRGRARQPSDSNLPIIENLPAMRAIHNQRTRP